MYEDNFGIHDSRRGIILCMLYQSVCLFVGIGSPHSVEGFCYTLSTRMSVPSSELVPPAPSPASECLPHLAPNGREEHSLAGMEVGGPNSYDWKESLALRILCASPPPPKRVCLPPLSQRGKQHSPGGVGLGNPIRTTGHNGQKAWHSVYSVMIGLIATELSAGILEHGELGTELLYRSARLHRLPESNTGLLKCLQI
jgi:hypothetical protein